MFVQPCESFRGTPNLNMHIRSILIYIFKYVCPTLWKLSGDTKLKHAYSIIDRCYEHFSLSWIIIIPKMKP